jgi:hypothetical protein
MFDLLIKNNHGHLSLSYSYLYNIFFMVCGGGKILLFTVTLYFISLSFYSDIYHGFPEG